MKKIEADNNLSGIKSPQPWTELHYCIEVDSATWIDLKYTANENWSDNFYIAPE